MPAALLALCVVTIKPWVFCKLFTWAGEKPDVSLEVGFRLGQISEFSMLISVLALNSNVIGKNAAYLIQLATLLSFIVSSYLIVFKYPTPIAVTDKLRRD